MAPPDMPCACPTCGSALNILSTALVPIRFVEAYRVPGGEDVVMVGRELLEVITVRCERGHLRQMPADALERADTPATLPCPACFRACLSQWHLGNHACPLQSSLLPNLPRSA